MAGDLFLSGQARQESLLSKLSENSGTPIGKCSLMKSEGAGLQMHMGISAGISIARA